MAKEAYVDAVRRSGLVAPHKLENLISAIDGSNTGQPMHVVLSQRLLDEKLITPWQQERLLRGHSRGFFLKSYRVLCQLGTGAMSTVYLAEHTSLRRRVAIKVLNGVTANNASLVERFHRESRVTAALDHRHIVRVFDFENNDPLHYLVMEYIEGTNLQAIVDANGPLGYVAAAQYIAQAAEGLAYAHSQGLVHRDVKPANLLVTSEGVVKVSDLGLARIGAAEGGPSITVAEGSILGTVDFLAPEQALDSHRVTDRADVYSLGCTFYFLLNGASPYSSGSMAMRLMKHQTDAAPSLYDRRPDAPEDLAQMITWMMAKEPEQRPSMIEMAEMLHEWIPGQRDLPAHAPTPRFVPSVPTGDTVSDLNTRAGMSTVLREPNRLNQPAPTPPPAVKPAAPAPADRMVPISCGQCQTRLVAPTSAVGRHRKCPNCGARVLVTADSPDSSKTSSREFSSLASPG